MTGLTTSQVTQIMRDRLAGREATVLGEDADRFRSEFEKDIALAEEKGWIIEIPIEWEV